MTDLDARPSAPSAKGTHKDERGVPAALIDAVEVTLQAQLGSTTMTVAELTALAEGAIVTLDATLAAAVSLRLNGVTIARGELVAVGDNFAVRLTELG